ncbi:hypothetical protein B0H10DRAFT_1945860 [Mycena sp. CBHHK59/15]|nr:hypothetical protein B0H10DRAFT_1945860 [Mycena sp. CBHHK59/15]
MVDAPAWAAHDASTTTLRGEDQMNNVLWTEPQLAQHRGSKPNDDAPASIRCREYTIPQNQTGGGCLGRGAAGCKHRRDHRVCTGSAPAPAERTFGGCIANPAGVPIVSGGGVWVEAQLDVNTAGTIVFVRGAPQRQQSARLVDAIANPAAEGVGRSDCRPREVVVRRQEVFGVIVSAPYALAWAPVCYSQCLAPVAPGDAVRLCFGAGGGLGSRRAAAGWAPASCKGGAGLSVCGQRQGEDWLGRMRVSRRVRWCGPWGRLSRTCEQGVRSGYKREPALGDGYLLTRFWHVAGARGIHREASIDGVSLRTCNK